MDAPNICREGIRVTNIDSHGSLHTIERAPDQSTEQIHLNSLPTETRIEIHSMPSSNQDQPENLNFMLRNTFSSILSRQSDPRRWEMNFRSVMQGVRPLVQQAQTMNNFHPLIPPRDTLLQDLPPRNENDEIGNGGNLQIPRIESSHLETTAPQYPSTNSGRNLLNTMQMNRPSFDEIGTAPERPIHDRVAALTRDDPPYLDSPNTEPTRQQESGNNSSQFNSLAEHFLEVQLSYRNLTGCLPFISLIILKSVYDNFGSLVYAGHFTLAAFLFMYSNKVVCKQAMLQRQKQIVVLLRTQFSIIFWWYLLTASFPDESGIYIIAPLPTNISLSELLCRTIYVDLLIKMLTVLVKLSIIVFPNPVIGYTKRGRVFTFLESISQLYRSLAPIQTWLIYTYNYYRDWERFVGVFFTVCYLTFKCCNLFSHVKFFGKSLIGLFRNRNIGLPATKEDLENSGGLCPICHENFNTPVKLDCKHVFCETCVGTWFSKQLTCPLCRANVKEDLCWASGATAVYVQFY